MGGKNDLFKLINPGKTPEEVTRIPTLDESFNDFCRVLNTLSEAPLLPLGLSLTEGHISVTQDERENHFWILGSTGEGKSKFLEYLIRKDIDRLLDEQKRGIDPKDGYACSLCFIDPTPQGKIAQLVLNYCAQIGFKKVLLVDPYLIRRGKVPPINPFHYRERHIETSVDYVMDAFRVLFEVEDLSRTAMITTYLKALLTLLHYGELTLSDLVYFTTPFDPDISESIEQKFVREKIFERIEQKIPTLPPYIQKILHKHLGDVKFAYKNIPNFVREVGSTARRINQAVTSPALNLIFGHRKGVNFEKLISEGWVLLVNASTGEGLGALQSRLLATIVVNEIIFTIEKIRRHGFNKPYYLYLDEASRYATDKLVEVLDVKRNIGLRLILSNQFPSQLKKRGIYDSVKTNAKTKISFYISSPDERRDVVSMLYGGALSDRDVSYALSQQEKRQAVFKLGKHESVLAKTYDVPDAPFDNQFLETLLQSRNYVTPDEIQQDHDERFERQDSVRTPRGAKSNRKATGAASGRKGGHRKQEPPADAKAESGDSDTYSNPAWDDQFS